MGSMNMIDAIDIKDVEPYGSMDDYVESGLKVLRHGDKIPKKLIKECAGIVLLQAEEGGIAITGQGGCGVALQHKKGEWSNPIAVDFLSVGGGLVFGYANKCVIMLLNHMAMDKLLKGQFSMSIGVDAGFAVGKTGRAAAADIEISNKGGLGSSLVYTFSQGFLFSVEAVLGARMNPSVLPNKNFYGTDSFADIIEGKVAPPDGSKVPALLEELAKMENGPEDEKSEG